jgi:DNA-binding HxlR family transcriptional regulator
MALPREYLDQECGLARSLEIVGERWTLLIIRDAFYGVSRFSDFRDHLGIPRAVLSERLAFLVDEGVLERATGHEYALTDKGKRLWPAMWSLLSWGNDFYMPQGRRRRFTHNGCGGTLGPNGSCDSCGAVLGPDELSIHPQSGRRRTAKTDPVSIALRRPHPLLTPIGEAASARTSG